MSLLQLIYPGVIATGDSQRVDILRDGDVPDDHPVIRLAHGFANSEGLVLHRFQRAGTQRHIPEDWAESTKSTLRTARAMTAGLSHEIYTRPDAESTPERTHTRDDIGRCHISTAGLVLDSEQAVLGFLQTNTTTEENE